MSLKLNRRRRGSNKGVVWAHVRGMRLFCGRVPRVSRARAMFKRPWPFHTPQMSPKRPPFSRRLALALVRVLVAGAALGSIAGLLGSVWWGFDLASHFQVYYFTAGVFGLIVGIAIKKRFWASVGGAVAIYAGCLLMQFWSGGPGMLDKDQASLRVVHFNVLSSNSSRKKVAGWLKGRDADLILVQEVDERWLSTLEQTLSDYKVELAEPRTDNFGVALFVRKKPGKRGARRVKAELLRLDNSGAADVPSISIRLRFDQRDLGLLYVHTLPPMSEEYAGARGRQISVAARWANAEREQGRAPLVIGDLNATPFSADFDTLGTSGLFDSSRGFGYSGSFPASFPSFASIPIDHALHDGSLKVVDRSYGPNFGSDHRPLEVVFAWRDPFVPKVPG